MSFFLMLSQQKPLDRQGASELLCLFGSGELWIWCPVPVADMTCAPTRCIPESYQESCTFRGFPDDAKWVIS